MHTAPLLRGYRVAACRLCMCRSQSCEYSRWSVVSVLFVVCATEGAPSMAGAGGAYVTITMTTATHVPAIVVAAAHRAPLEPDDASSIEPPGAGQGRSASTFY